MYIASCASFSRDYWNFEWCHRQEIRQVHWQLDEGKLSRSPDWSLGVYESSVVIRERNEAHNLSAPIVKVFLVAS